MGRKNIILICISILIVAGAFLIAEYWNGHNKKVVYNAVLTTPKETISPELETMDSDADNLKDWEEVLLGTDPHKVDTDGDGTPDGKEVGLGRNPLVKGPNDSQKATATNGIASENLTPTDKLARDFFARYMQLNQMGLAGDAQSQQELVNQVMAKGVVLAVPKSYQQKDIIVSSDSSVEAVRKYANAVGTIFNKYQNRGRDEAIIAKDSTIKGDPSILKEIDPIITVYKNTVNALLRTPVPADMVNIHINLINVVSKFSFIAEGLRQSDVDAMRGLQSVGMYLDTGKELVAAMQAIKNKLTTLNISFSSSEGGSLFQQ